MTETVAAARPADRPAGGWIDGIEDIYLGRWVHPETGVKAKRAPFDLIAVEESLDGAEADLVGRLGFAGDMVVVADAATWDAMGARVAKALKAKASVVLDHPHADMGAIADLTPRIAGFDHVIAVGSGTTRLAVVRTKPRRGSPVSSWLIADSREANRRLVPQPARIRPMIDADGDDWAIPLRMSSIRLLIGGNSDASDSTSAR